MATRIHRRQWAAGHLGGDIDVNRRQVRAVAVFGLVVVALTGARHSHGGGCGHSSSDSSSSSSSSGGYSSSGSTTSSGTTGSTPTDGSTTQPETDIRITDCTVDNTAGKLTAKLSVTNGNSQRAATYNGSVMFNDGSGAALGSGSFSTRDVPAGSTEPVTVTDTFVKIGDQQTGGGECKLGSSFKINR
ncbi:hypothetical protein [Streptomyces sp. NPDC101393]|uniref:hypothetical protein n=1 Tax=Streptomyces sp. NPDC101393 TaxID=3366141 RepID=UPI003818EE64